ncbi:protein kinase domain-containing protein [Sorangium sp. So ce131]|uniref:serine/threonine-protein kinase n=1 Tax=Sorangium sp. So ce131 TaxID=3133282 RepID=UPI003F625ADB
MSDPATRLPSLAPVEPGTVLAGKYRVERIIGQGGMGVVVEARHVALDERVALKFLLPEFTRHPEGSARFLREAQAAVKIKSEHVARVSDFGTLGNGAPYMVMEFLTGSDLARLLEHHGTLAVEDAVDYVVQGCEAIAEAHGHGIVHRDLKPANLFLTRRADGSPLVKVLDFGISKMATASGGIENLTSTSAALGSALYMSPEQMRQTRSVDHRTDIYALGISLFELLAGRQPFYAETLPQLCAEVLTGTPTPLRSLRPDAPEALASALARAYERDRERRYTSVAELVVALAPFAPSRTHPTIDRIARMGGLPPVAATFGGQRASHPSFAGVDPRASTPPPREPSWPRPPSPSAPGQDGAAATWQASTPPPYVQPPHAQPPHAQPPHASPTGNGAPGQHAPTDGWLGQAPPGAPAGTRAPGAPPAPPANQQIVPGPYNAPMSIRAAATFASATHMGISSDGRRLPSSPVAVLAIALLSAALLLGIVATVVVLRNRGDDPSQAAAANAPASAASATEAPEMPSSLAQEEAKIQPAGAADPSAPAAIPAPVASSATAASSEPAASAAPAASSAPPARGAPAPVQPRGGAGRPTPPARPSQIAPTQRPPQGIDLNDPH